jgi:hypothetical protein
MVSKKPENSMENRKRKPLPVAARPYCWKPGQSGNPGGRPKTAILSEAYRQALESVDPKTLATIAEKIAEALVAKALEGDIRACAEIANRTEGRPQMRVEVKDLTDDLNRSDEELQFFVANGVWPEQIEQDLGSE